MRSPLGDEGEAVARRSLPPPAYFAGGLLLGALSWLVALAVSGRFEPYDSASGLLVNQLVLAGAAGVLALRHRPRAFLLCLLGSYVGMNVYTYAFGGSEHRVWALLGAFSSALLLVPPAVVGAAAAVVRRLRAARW